MYAAFFNLKRYEFTNHSNFNSKEQLNSENSDHVILFQD